MMRYACETEFNGTLVTTAYCAIAALLQGGDTLSGMTQVNFGNSKNSNDATNLKPLNTAAKMKRLKDSFQIGKAKAILVDKISTMSPSFLAALSEHLKLATGNTQEDFGGLQVVLLGDFSQLPPVGGASLTDAVMKVAKWDRQKAVSTEELELKEWACLGVETASKGKKG